MSRSVILRALVFSFFASAPAQPTAAQQRYLAAEPGTNAVAFRDQPGRKLTFVCPPGLRPGTVWGTSVYTDDSSICSAAVHAGVISRDRGGPVTIVMGTNKESFEASTQNEVESRKWDAWSGSFSFVRESGGGQLDWTTTARGVPPSLEGPLNLVCPPNGQPSTIYGTGVYTDDSSICVAAVHSGVIGIERGGPIQFEVAGPQRSYTGATRNGIDSRQYSTWGGSFRLAGGIADSLEIGRAEGAATVPITVRPAPGTETPTVPITVRPAPGTLTDSLDNFRLGARADSLDNFRIGTRVDSLDNFRIGSVADSLDNFRRGTLADSLDNFRKAAALFTRVARPSITSVPGPNGTQQLSLSLLDATGVGLSATELRSGGSSLPVTWTSSNPSCVSFLTGSGASPTATGMSVTTRSSGCASTITAKVANPTRDVRSTLPSEKATTLQIRAP